MGNRHTEQPPDPILYGGRPSGGFVNRAVIRMYRFEHCTMKSEQCISVMGSFCKQHIVLNHVFF